MVAAATASFPKEAPSLIGESASGSKIIGFAMPQRGYRLDTDRA
jgi:hypothetical protein